MSEGRSSCCSDFSRADSLAHAAANQPAQPKAGGSAIAANSVVIPGGTYFVGTNDKFLPQDGEGPKRKVRIDAFRISRCAVTNAEFAAFVKNTGYVTDAERFGWSFAFHLFAPAGPAAAVAAAEWWVKVEGACWNRPNGPGSDTASIADHPVTHISLDDAEAFARWAGGRLPTETEWEIAAAGGLPNPRYPWGDRHPDDQDYFPCNIWQGEFPSRNNAKDGFAGTAPVASFAPNGYGLYNMSGNTWEWCSDVYRVRSLRKSARDNNQSARSAGKHVLKGGSYLCHASYCWRYRIAARSSATRDSSTGHIGFRVAFDC